MAENTTDRERGTGVEITDEDEFEARLQQLIRDAAGGGVEVRGGWEVETASGSGWDVEIVGTRKPASVELAREDDAAAGPP
jgi:hypothetical protein